MAFNPNEFDLGFNVRDLGAYRWSNGTSVSVSWDSTGSVDYILPDQYNGASVLVHLEMLNWGSSPSFSRILYPYDEAVIWRDITEGQTEPVTGNPGNDVDTNLFLQTSSSYNLSSRFIDFQTPFRFWRRFTLSFLTSVAASGRYVFLYTIRYRYVEDEVFKYLWVRKIFPDNDPPEYDPDDPDRIYTWSSSGPLPNGWVDPPTPTGMSMDEDTNELTGTPTGENNIITIRKLVGVAGSKVWFESI